MLCITVLSFVSHSLPSGRCYCLNFTEEGVREGKPEVTCQLQTPSSSPSLGFLVSGCLLVAYPLFPRQVSPSLRTFSMLSRIKIGPEQREQPRPPTEGSSVGAGRVPEMIGNLMAGLFCEGYRRPVRMNRRQCRSSQRTGVIMWYW